MGKLGVIFIVAIAIAVLFMMFGPTKTAPNGQSADDKNITSSSTMTITSPAFEHNGKIPKKYTCDGSPPSAPSGGGGINPPLTISGVPEGAKSLALIMDDPDAPKGVFVHWVIYYINPDTKEIPEGTGGNIGLLGKTSFGKIGYGGPCPPSGAHRYFFKLYAIDEDFSMLENPPFTKEEVEGFMEGHILARAELIGIYER